MSSSKNVNFQKDSQQNFYLPASVHQTDGTEMLTSQFESKQMKIIEN